MSQRVSARRHPRLAALAALLLLALPAIALPVRAAAGIGVNVHTGDTQVHVGDTVKYVFEVDNPGDVRLNGLLLTGDLCDSGPTFVSGDTSSDNYLDPGETFLYDCPHKVTEREPEIMNKADVSGNPDGGGAAVTATDTASVSVLHPAIALEISIGQEVLVGQKIVYGFSVLNIGDTPVNDVVFDADNLCLTPITFDGRDDGNDGWIAPDAMEAWFYSCDGPVVGAGDTAFHAAAAVRAEDALDLIVSATGTGDAIVIHPGITFTSAAKSPTAHPGDTITFTYKLTDTGDTHIGTITILTTACDEGTLKYGAPEGFSGLHPGDIWNGSCTHKVTEKVGSTVKNVFSFTAAGGIFLEATAQASVTIVAKAAAATPTPIPATPTAEPSASTEPSVEPSAAPSIAATEAPITLAPATPAPTLAPVPATSEGSGFPIVLVIVLIVVLVAAIGGWLLYQRRRVATGV